MYGQKKVTIFIANNMPLPIHQLKQSSWSRKSTINKKIASQTQTIISLQLYIPEPRPTEYHDYCKSIQTNSSSSDDDTKNTPTNYIPNTQNSNISINPWQDMPQLSQTTHSETKSTHKNSDDNSDYHYSNTLLYKHEQDNSFNKTSTLWNRNFDTIVWTKQNLMNRIVDTTTQ